MKKIRIFGVRWHGGNNCLFHRDCSQPNKKDLIFRVVGTRCGYWPKKDESGIYDVDDSPSHENEMATTVDVRYLGSLNEYLSAMQFKRINDGGIKRRECLISREIDGVTLTIRFVVNDEQADAVERADRVWNCEVTNIDGPTFGWRQVGYVATVKLLGEVIGGGLVTTMEQMPQQEKPATQPTPRKSVIIEMNGGSGLGDLVARTAPHKIRQPDLAEVVGAALNGQSVLV